jgi:hypothetical protein
MVLQLWNVLSAVMRDPAFWICFQFRYLLRMFPAIAPRSIRAEVQCR